MNLIVGAPWWLIAFVTLVLAAAAIEDAARLRISNLTCAAVAVGAFIAVAVHGFSPALWQNLLVCLAIFAVGTAMFGAGLLGGGDVKLFAALGLWFNLSAAAGLMAAVFLAGGVIALIFIIGRRIVPGNRSADVRSGKIPYGLAIVAGAAFIMAVQLNSRPSNTFIDHIRTAEAANHFAR
jgi:prepilin peptidase CpaA